MNGIMTHGISDRIFDFPSPLWQNENQRGAQASTPALFPYVQHTKACGRSGLMVYSPPIGGKVVPLGTKGGVFPTAARPVVWFS